MKKMLPHNISIDLNKYCVVKHRTTSELYAALSQDWQTVSQQREQQMTSMDKGVEITCYKLSFDIPTNCYRLTDNTIKINSSELSGVPVDISH